MHKISNFVKERFNHNQNKQLLKEKYEAKMLFASQGGMWKAGPELIMLLGCCPDDAVIIDQYETPVNVNVLVLQKEVQMRWQEQMNGWLAEYDLSNSKR